MARMISAISNPSTTSNIRRHIVNTNIKLFNLLSEKKKRLGSSEGEPKQMHLNKKAKIEHFSQAGFNNLLIKYAILMDNSFLSIEHPVIVELFQYLHPEVKVPRRKGLRALIFKKYDSSFLELKQILSKVRLTCFNK